MITPVLLRYLPNKGIISLRILKILSHHMDQCQTFFQLMAYELIRFVL